MILLTPHPRAREWKVSFRSQGPDWKPAELHEPGHYFTPYHKVPAGHVAWALDMALLLPEGAEAMVVDPSLELSSFPIHAKTAELPTCVFW